MSWKAKALVFSVGVGLALLYAGYRLVGSAESYAFVDNTFDHAVEIAVNGEGRGELVAGQSLTLDVEPGAQYEVVATQEGQEIHRGAFTAPKGEGKILPRGSRSLYVVGPTRVYAVVTVAYGAGSSSVSPFEPDQPFVPLPADVSEAGLNAAFPESVTTAGSQGSSSRTHLCHLDEPSESIGCPNAE